VCRGVSAARVGWETGRDDTNEDPDKDPQPLPRAEDYLQVSMRRGHLERGSTCLSSLAMTRCSEDRLIY
jgi:hypothetical protein